MNMIPKLEKYDRFEERLFMPELERKLALKKNFLTSLGVQLAPGRP